MNVQIQVDDWDRQSIVFALALCHLVISSEEVPKEIRESAAATAPRLQDMLERIDLLRH